MVSRNNNDNSIPAAQIRLLQLIFDKFSVTGKWPNCRLLQIEFLPDEFWTAIDKVDQYLINRYGSKSQSDSQAVLSISGIAACNNSNNHTSLFIRALNACIEFYKSNPENPILTTLQLQELASFSEDESHRAMGLLFIGDRTWSSASGSLVKQITELKLNPDILNYLEVTNIEQYLKIAKQFRPRETNYYCVDLRRIELKDKIHKTFSILDARIVERCQGLFHDGHYSEAIEASFKVVRDRLRQLTGYERSQEAFGKAKLHIEGAVAANVDKNFNEGIKFMLMAIDKFRNVKSHTSKDMIEDPAHAYEYLNLSSLAMRFLDRVTPVKN
ncbi:MAG: TIGR02391 family protein [candidate division Zixibacteria bacterium]|nr:TIGR02391 family protein [candidate division Zixibacteria bacterium]